MTVVIDGLLGVSLVQDSTITNAKLAPASTTADKLSGAQTGSAPVYGCRAWCNFDGTLVGTNAPRAGGNVASVTRNSVGDYTINFTTAMPDANYAVNITIGGVTNCYLCRTSEDVTPRTASVFRINCVNGNNTATIDPPQISIAVFR